MKVVLIHDDGAGWPRGTGHKTFQLIRGLIGGEYAASPYGAALAVARLDRTGHADRCRDLDVPYILVVNDSYSMRQGRAADRGECNAVSHAVACIYVAPSLLAHHTNAGIDIPPHEIVLSRPFASDLDFEPLPKLGPRDLVYAGGLAGWRSRPRYRDLTEDFARMTADGWTVHLYSPSLTSDESIGHYQDAGCVVHPAMPYPAIVRELSQYAGGLLALHDSGDFAYAYARAALPNKTFDYLASGIPTVLYNAPDDSARIAAEWSVQYAADMQLPPIDEDVRRREVIDRDEPIVRKLLERVGVITR